MMREFTTKEAAEISGVTVYTLRYYEQIGLILDTKRAAIYARRRYDSRSAL